MPGLSDFEATTSRSSCLLYLERGLEAERDSDPSDAPPHAGKLDQHPRLLGLENGRRDDASCSHDACPLLTERAVKAWMGDFVAGICTIGEGDSGATSPLSA
uniref:Uncharacterized protein B9J10.020 n=1 Tax=Neurospora crassa TaxID=5141 RepID=Q96TY6_NEUCS|nr:hypothetical protein [Neurospora crassa]